MRTALTAIAIQVIPIVLIILMLLFVFLALRRRVLARLTKVSTLRQTYYTTDHVRARYRLDSLDQQPISPEAAARLAVYTSRTKDADLPAALEYMRGEWRPLDSPYGGGESRPPDPQVTGGDEDHGVFST